MGYVRGLRCRECGAEYPAVQRTVCEACFGPLEVAYEIDAVRAAFEAMIAGKLNATVECNPLLGPQLMTSVTEVVAGRPIAKRIVVDEEPVFTADNARQLIQSRKY